MQNYTFHWEIKDLITQFLQAMDGCVLKRYDENKSVEKEVSLGIKYMPKTRTLHYLVNKQQHITLPVMSVWIGSVSRDNSRCFNKHDGPVYTSEAVSKPLQPVPINIVMNVSLLAKYQNDMDQMVSNFVPYFDPYIILSWNHPSVDREIRSEVEWNGSLTYNYPLEPQASEAYRVGVDTSFTIKGWLFKKADSSIGQIYTINADFIGISGFDGIPTDPDLYEEFRDDLDYDRMITTSGDV